MTSKIRNALIDSQPLFLIVIFTMLNILLIKTINNFQPKPIGNSLIILGSFLLFFLCIYIAGKHLYDSVD